MIFFQLKGILYRPRSRCNSFSVNLWLIKYPIGWSGWSSRARPRSPTRSPAPLGTIWRWWRRPRHALRKVFLCNQKKNERKRQKSRKIFPFYLVEWVLRDGAIPTTVSSRLLLEPTWSDLIFALIFREFPAFRQKLKFSKVQGVDLFDTPWAKKYVYESNATTVVAPNKTTQKFSDKKDK